MQCCFTHGIERGGRAYSKIEDGPIEPPEVRRVRPPQVDFDGSLVCEAEQACCRVDQRQWNPMVDGDNVYLYPGPASLYWNSNVKEIALGALNTEFKLSVERTSGRS